MNKRRRHKTKARRAKLKKFSMFFKMKMIGSYPKNSYIWDMVNYENSNNRQSNLN